MDQGCRRCDHDLFPHQRRQLRLSRLIGLDFILEDGTGHAHLIEMNARATKICHMQLGTDRDLLAPLRAILSGEAPRETVPLTKGDVIALFPQERLRYSTSKFLSSGYHDIPWAEPDLLRECLTDTIEFRAWSRLSKAARARKAWLAGTSRHGIDGAPPGAASQVWPVEMRELPEPRAAVDDRCGALDRAPRNDHR